MDVPVGSLRAEPWRQSQVTLVALFAAVPLDSLHTSPDGCQSQAVLGVCPLGHSHSPRSSRCVYKLPGRYWQFVLDSSEKLKAVFAGFSGPGRKDVSLSAPRWVLN